ncbi:hypothetical protein GLAREA_07577 [Glarea lozoyensis ATCC 20868]|uniref:Uncharacterized protein n=1 Tax=Glarea lozoyensis (strain ATCC 20868 / MF5171) TaxID=1116229 RepID=S3D5P0_GLAL2|nr:uncharacterized protein GLAREA_07577 [Glarea lozoyensis ATCC 20868]EPE32444.1 hypothetical protein GLAREA_07577 [Glarea lozoyensis ATCC 20868]
MIFTSFLATLVAIFAATLAHAYPNEEHPWPTMTPQEIALAKETWEEGEKSNTVCCPVPGQSWQASSKETVRDNLKMFKAKPKPLPPPKTCKQMWCDKSTEIIFCNTNLTAVTDERIDLDAGVGLVGAYVNSTLHNCPNSCGQVFADSMGFNVIIAGGATCEKNVDAPVHGSGPKID